MDWKYLGERDLIAVMHGQHYPVKWDANVDWAFDEGWEMRHVYVIEGTSKLPQYAYGKRVLFTLRRTGSRWPRWWQPDTDAAAHCTSRGCGVRFAPGQHGHRHDGSHDDGRSSWARARS
jgi:hypothetical protein